MKVTIECKAQDINEIINKQGLNNHSLNSISQLNELLKGRAINAEDSNERAERFAEAFSRNYVRAEKLNYQKYAYQTSTENHLGTILSRLNKVDLCKYKHAKETLLSSAAELNKLVNELKK